MEKGKTPGFWMDMDRRHFFPPSLYDLHSYEASRIEQYTIVYVLYIHIHNKRARPAQEIGGHKS